MAINISAQYYGGLLPGIILLTRCGYILRSPFETKKSFCPYNQCSRLNRLTIFPLKVDAQKVEMSSDFS